MSLGPTLHRRNISDRQFTGDLSSLFARHRIAPGSACAFANFESRFALSEAFRSQLFTLCTAISHMSEADLTGDQLLALIVCALKSTETSDVRAELPEWLRVEFEEGYDAWNARDLSKADEWQTRPQPTHFDLVPFTQPDEKDLEQAVADVDVDVERLTLDELARLLEKMEHRIGRLKPHIQLSTGVASEREEISSAPVEQVARPAPGSVQIDDAAFLARHAYLKPERRVVSIDRAVQLAASSPIAWEGSASAAAPPVATAAGSPPANEAAEGTTAGLPCREAPTPPRKQGPVSANQRMGRSRVSLSMAVKAFAASAMFVIIAGGLAGIVFYPSAVATYFNRPSGLGPRVEKSAEITQVSANPGPLANAPTNGARRGPRALSRNKWNAKPSKPKPATDGVTPLPQ